MKSAKVVIGANWGDEGKGLMTDYFAIKYGVVVRFNGGSQAAHTCQLSNGTRHVFHHFSSGSFKNATTNLSRHFISNPYLFVSEKHNLENLGIHPKVNADPRGLVTTPYDMMLNQMAEEARGDARHGSCGIGINETIKRQESLYKLTVEMLFEGEARLALILEKIRKEWVHERAEQLKIKIPEIWKNRIENETILLNFIKCIKHFDVSLFKDVEYLKGFDDIVFEGAQGLLLDQNHYFFPHVTHSHTGLKNVIEISKEANITHLDVTYVTRAYATRHGAGPFPHENLNIKYEDATNVPNEWQGGIRFGYLDLDLLSESISKDIQENFDKKISINPGIAVTCLDQVDEITVVSNKNLVILNHKKFLEEIENKVKIPVTHMSYGPTRNDVKPKKINILNNFWKSNMKDFTVETAIEALSEASNELHLAGVQSVWLDMSGSGWTQQYEIIIDASTTTSQTFEIKDLSGKYTGKFVERFTLAPVAIDAIRKAFSDLYVGEYVELHFEASQNMMKSNLHTSDLIFPPITRLKDIQDQILKLQNELKKWEMLEKKSKKNDMIYRTPGCDASPCSQPTGV